MQCFITEALFRHTTWKMLATLLYALLFLTAARAQAAQFEIDAFGDSITAGWPYIEDPPWGARTTEGYEPTLETLTASQTNNTALVYNWGFPGENSSTLLGRVGTVAAHQGKFILLMAGANDPYQGVGAGTTIFNLSTMIDISRTNSTIPILATVTPNTDFPGWTPILDDMIRQLAVDKEVILSDQYTALVGNWGSLNSGDGLHPNTKGYEIMAQTWLDALLKDETFNPPPLVNIAPIVTLLLGD